MKTMMRLGFSLLLALAVVGQGGCGGDSAPRDQYVRGTCVVTCDGTEIYSLAQGPTCFDSEITDLVKVNGLLEQRCAQEEAQVNTQCAVFCFCEIHWTGNECE